MYGMKLSKSFVERAGEDRNHFSLVDQSLSLQVKKKWTSNEKQSATRQNDKF